MKRRAVWAASVAAVAGAAGVGAAIWRARSAASSAPAIDVWSLRFDTPQGGRLALASWRGKPLLLNFWATWCPPCVSEMPLIDRFGAAHAAAGWQVVGLAVDNVAPVVAFLGKHPVTFPIGLAGADGVGLARSLGNSSGALPFTVVFDRRGGLVQRKLGVVSEDDLARWASTVG